jgi:hypothetical protein
MNVGASTSYYGGYAFQSEENAPPQQNEPPQKTAQPKIGKQHASHFESYAHCTLQSYARSIKPDGIAVGNGETRGLPEGNRPGVYAWTSAEAHYVTPAHETVAIFSKDATRWRSNANSDGGVMTEQRVQPARDFSSRSRDGVISVVRPLTPRTIDGMNRFHRAATGQRTRGDQGAQALLNDFNQKFPYAGFATSAIASTAQSQQGAASMDEIEDQVDNNFPGMGW